MGLRSRDLSREDTVRSAHSAAWVRSATPIRWNRFVRWPFTVFSLIPRRRAICLFARPSTTRRSTSRSRAVSSTSPARDAARRRGARRPPRGERCLAARGGWIARVDLLGFGVLQEVAHGAGVERADDLVRSLNEVNTTTRVSGDTHHEPAG